MVFVSVASSEVAFVVSAVLRLRNAIEEGVAVPWTRVVKTAAPSF